MCESRLLAVLYMLSLSCRWVGGCASEMTGWGWCQVGGVSLQLDMATWGGLYNTLQPLYVCCLSSGWAVGVGSSCWTVGYGGLLQSNGPLLSCDMAPTGACTAPCMHLVCGVGGSELGGWVPALCHCCLGRAGSILHSLLCLSPLSLYPHSLYYLLCTLPALLMICVPSDHTIWPCMWLQATCPACRHILCQLL